MLWVAVAGMKWRWMMMIPVSVVIWVIVFIIALVEEE